MNKVPSPVCFLEENDRRNINWGAIAKDREDLDYEASYDFDVDNYEIVDTINGCSDYGDIITSYVIRRKTDGKHFKLCMYDDSWFRVYNGWAGESGEVTEVIGKEVMKMEWTDIAKDTIT